MGKFTFGIDHGNGYVKAESENRKILRKSEYSLPEDVRQDVLKGDNSLHLDKYSVGRYGDKKVVWGDDIQKVGAPITTHATFDRYNQQEYRILSEIVLADLLPDDLEGGIAEVSVVTGCPSTEHGSALEKDLIAVYKGGHFIVINEKRQVMINVTDVTVLPQPLGSVLSLYLTNDGYVADESYETGYIGVIDIGSGTVDIDGINELAREPKDTDTFDLGVLGAYQEIATYLNSTDPSIKATAQRVERQMYGGKIESYEVNKSKKIDISDKADAIFRAHASKIKAAINSRWGDRQKFDKIILTGGGAEIKPIVDEIKKWHPDIIVVENSQEANATGFYRYGKYLARVTE